MLLKCSVISGAFLYRSVCVSVHSLSAFALCVNSPVALRRWTLFLALKRNIWVIYHGIMGSSLFWLWHKVVFLRWLHFGIYYLNYVNIKRKKDFVYIYSIIWRIYLFLIWCDTHGLFLSLSQTDWPCSPKTLHSTSYML